MAFNLTSGFRGNSALKRKGEQLEWSEENIAEFIKCRDDIFYFIKNYFKIVSGGKLISMQLRDYQIDVIRSMVENNHTLMVQSRQSGKALDLNTPILTTEGFKKFKDVHIGDEIYSVDGKKTKVIFETETMYNHKCYKIKFSHGEEIICDADHVWTIDHKGQNKNFTSTKLKDYFDRRIKQDQSVRIKIAEPLQFDETSLLIDPYLLGLWLGDGTSKLGYITCHVDDLNFYENYIDVEKIKEDNRRPDVKTVKIRNLISKLRELNLLSNKRIPKDYIFNSIENRLALIQGLMDTDGSVSNKGSCEFYQKNIHIIEQFRFILSSLGVKSTLRSKIINNETYYTVAFCNRKYDFFRLKRKLDVQKERFISDHLKNNFFYIKSMEETDTVPVKCIQVDNPSHLFLCGNSLIPTHNTEAIRAFVCWYIIFHDYKLVGIVANKESTANEILYKVQESYKNLPKWLQQSVIEFNKSSIILENNSRVLASSTSSDSMRGFSANILIIDEAAHVDNWEEFYSAVYPIISADPDGKIIMASTPKGLNHFYEFYMGSTLKENTNGFKGFFVPWWRVPGRDEAWKIKELASMNNNIQRFAQEYDCAFEGSSGTLIAGWALNYLKDNTQEPKFKDGHLSMYEYPVKEVKEWVTSNKEVTHPAHKYTLVADVSRGKDLDYSAFSIFDITEMPYKQVCTYRNNKIAPRDYADIIHRIAQHYNDAVVLVEINDIGEQIGDILIYDLEYENVLCTEAAGKAGKRIVFSAKKADKGIRTSPGVKLSGCLLLKLLVEQKKILIPDLNTVNELLTFSKVNNTYKAEKNKFDDLAMGLVLFAWLSNTTFFKDLTEINTIGELREKTLEEIKQELLPFGYMEPIIPEVEYEFYPTTRNIHMEWNIFNPRQKATIVPNF